jgi:hypothetical protein
MLLCKEVAKVIKGGKGKGDFFHFLPVHFVSLVCFVVSNAKTFDVNFIDRYLPCVELSRVINLLALVRMAN